MALVQVQCPDCHSADVVHARSYGEVGNTGLFSGTSGGKRLKVLEQKK